MDVERAVRQRYSESAKAAQPALCCATAYDPRLLEAIPAEVVERDYGCGDPTKHVRRGETVLDLGSGTGKACFLASQIVGPEGRVVGVDANDDMLEVARRNAPAVAARIGFANVEFRKGKIQNLRLDRDRVDAIVRERPVRSEADLARLEDEVAALERDRPLVPDGTIDVVVSNCVLNLVRPEDKRRLFAEIFRVLRRGGRAVISDIVCDRDVPVELQKDPELWSGCISGAFREDAFLHEFEEAGFHGITLLERSARPWQVVAGIEFRSVTVAAWKGKAGIGAHRGHAVVYRGPWAQVRDDDAHVLLRGLRTPVCERTFEVFSKEPYRSHVELVDVPGAVAPQGKALPLSGGCGPSGCC